MRAKTEIMNSRPALFQKTINMIIFVFIISISSQVQGNDNNFSPNLVTIIGTVGTGGEPDTSESIIEEAKINAIKLAEEACRGTPVKRKSEWTIIGSHRVGTTYAFSTSVKATFECIFN